MGPFCLEGSRANHERLAFYRIQVIVYKLLIGKLMGPERGDATFLKGPGSDL